MTVVYIDSVFLLNTLMDAVVLLATAQLAGLSPKKDRCFLASLWGGAYAAAVFFPGCGILAEWPGKTAAGVLMALIAFGGERHFLRLYLLFLAVSCGLAGSVMAVGMMAGGIPMENGIFYTDLDAGVLLTVAAAAYAVLSVVFRASASNRIRGVLIPVTLGWGERRLRLTALCDTGNSLKDPLTGRPVLIADFLKLRELFPEEIRPILTQANLGTPAELPGRFGEYRARFRLIPYQAVGVTGKMLLTVRVDWGEIGGKRYDRLAVALSPTELGDGFAALWGDVERSQVNGKNGVFLGKSAGETGIQKETGSPLHWRK